MIPFEQELELYHYSESLCSQKARVGLTEKNKPWKSRHIVLCDIALDCQNLDEEYLQVNPKGIVPTLVHDGEPVYDAHRIIRYVDEQYPNDGNSLWPTDAQRVAVAEYWFDEGMLDDTRPIGSNFGSAIAHLSRPLLAHMLQRQPLDAVVERYKHHPLENRGKGFVALRKGMMPPPEIHAEAMSYFIDGLQLLNSQLSEFGGPWLLGDFSVVDITMMACFHRLEDLHLDELLQHDKLPKLGEYWQRLQSRPSYQTAIVDWHDAVNWRTAIDEVFGDSVSPEFEQAAAMLAA